MQKSNLAAGQLVHTITLPPSDPAQKKRTANEASLLLDLQTPRKAMNSTSKGIPHKFQDQTIMGLNANFPLANVPCADSTKLDSHARIQTQLFQVLAATVERLSRHGVLKLRRHELVKAFRTPNQSIHSSLLLNIARPPVHSSLLQIGHVLPCSIETVESRQQSLRCGASMIVLWGYYQSPATEIGRSPVFQ